MNEGHEYMQAYDFRKLKFIVFRSKSNLKQRKISFVLCKIKNR